LALQARVDLRQTLRGLAGTQHKTFAVTAKSGFDVGMRQFPSCRDLVGCRAADVRAAVDDDVELR
jgi:hypothetical protein